MKKRIFSGFYLLLFALLTFVACKTVGGRSSLKDISADKFFWREIRMNPPKDTSVALLMMADPKTFIGFFLWENSERTSSELRVHRSSDGGKTFEEKPFAVFPEQRGPTFTDVAKDGTLSFGIVENSEGNWLSSLMLSHDKGQSWKKVPAPVLPNAENQPSQTMFDRVVFASWDYALAEVDGGRILETRDQGKTWKDISKDFQFTEEQRIEGIAAYDKGIYVLSSVISDEGFNSFVPPRDNFVSFVRDGKVLGMAKKLAFKSRGFGINGYKFLSENEAFYSDFNGAQLSKDGGKTFELVYPYSARGNPPIDRTAIRQPGSGGEVNVYFRSADLGIAVGNLGFVQVTRNGGQDWNDTPIDTAGSLSSVEFSGNYALLRAEDPFLGQVTYYASSLEAQAPKRTQFTALPIPSVKTSDGKSQPLSDAIPFDEMKAKTNFQRPGDTDYDANADGVVPPASARKHIAGLTILNALDEVRLTFHQNLPEGQEALFTKGVKVFPKIISDCLTNQTEHWSDLALHYYCQFAELRQCFTEQSRAYAEGLQNWLINWQSEHPEAAPDFLFAVSQGLVQPKAIRQTAYNNCKNDFYFQWLLDDPHRSDVFRAIMFGQALEFNDEEQQAVLNAFYGRMKPASEGPFDPYNKEDCNKYRPTRAIDPMDGTHCRPDCLAGEKPEDGRCKLRPEIRLRGVGR